MIKIQAKSLIIKSITKKQIEELILDENFTNDENNNQNDNVTSVNGADSNGNSEDLKNSDSVNIDEIQSAIMKKMAEDEDGESDFFDDFSSAPNYSQEVTSITENLASNKYYDISPAEKKYVFAIQPDAVPMLDGLSPEERSELVNTLLFKHIEAQKHSPEQLRIKKLIKHSFVVFLTIAFGFPAIFIITNASIEATVNSYRQIQGNFEKLYQQKGGIKRKDLTKIQNLQY